MGKKVEKSFKGKVSANAQKTKNNGAEYGYLKIPKGVSVYQPVPGAREKFDIIPYVVKVDNHPDRDEENDIATKGEIWYKRPFKVHKNVGSGNDAVVCLSSFGEKCPICEYHKKRIKEGASKEELAELKPKTRILYVVMPKGNKKVEEKLHVLDMSSYLFQDLLTEELEENEDYEMFPDLEEGYTLQVRWDDESFKGKSFAKASRIDFKERDEQYDADLCEEAPDLDAMLAHMPYSKMEELFFGDVTEDDEDEDEEPTKKPGKKSVKPPVEEEEEEDEEEEAGELTWDDINSMDATELSEVIEQYGLDVDTDDFDDDLKGLKKAVAVELDIEVPKKPTKIVKKETEKPGKKEVEKPSKKPGKKETTVEGTCPKGHTWGEDCDEQKDCNTCPLWDACFDAK